MLFLAWKTRNGDDTKHYGHDSDDADNSAADRIQSEQSSGRIFICFLSRVSHNVFTLWRKLYLV